MSSMYILHNIMQIEVVHFIARLATVQEKTHTHTHVTFSKKLTSVINYTYNIVIEQYTHTQIFMYIYICAL